MLTIRYLIVFLSICLIGCSQLNYTKHTKRNPSLPIPGTDTSVVQVGANFKGNTPTVFPEKIYIGRGKRIVLVGPDTFSIQFPNGSPFKKTSIPARKGVINLVVPKNAKAGKYKYDISIPGLKPLDPYMIIPE